MDILNQISLAKLGPYGFAIAMVLLGYQAWQAWKNRKPVDTSIPPVTNPMNNNTPLLNGILSILHTLDNRESNNQKTPAQRANEDTERDAALGVLGTWVSRCPQRREKLLSLLGTAGGVAGSVLQLAPNPLLKLAGTAISGLSNIPQTTPPTLTADQLSAFLAALGIQLPPQVPPVQPVVTKP